MNDVRDLLRLLAKHGLTRSAWALARVWPLGGSDVNPLKRQLRDDAHHPGIRSRIHMITTIRGVGLVVPAFVRMGQPTSQDPTFESQEAAFQAASAHLEVQDTHQRIPWTALEPFGPLELEGPSLGLAAALAFLSRLSGRQPGFPLVASGRIDANGSVLPVGQVALKMQAADLELAGTDGIVLLHPDDARLAPAGLAVAGVRDLSDAVRLVFGDVPLRVAPHLQDFEALVARCRRATDHHQAIHDLEAYPVQEFSDVDRARWLLALGSQYRHVGDAKKASMFHREVEELIKPGLLLDGAAELETMQIEVMATHLDEEDPSELERMLRQRLEQPFEVVHNRVRCRGQLAQVLVTLGQIERAIDVRRQNLPDQEHSSELRREFARTYCWLAISQALAGREDDYAHSIAEMWRTTLDGDDFQVRYNIMAHVRGEVLFGRHLQVVKWLKGAGDALPRPVPVLMADWLDAGKPIAGYPEIGTLRAVTRALRRLGKSNEATLLAGRVMPTKDFLGWHAELVRIEGCLAMAEAGRHAEALQHLRTSATRMREAHSRLCRTYCHLMELLDDLHPLERTFEIEKAVDRVFY